MGGFDIIVLTVIFGLLVVWMIKASFWSLARLNLFYNDTPVEYRCGTKALLLIPYIALALWVAVLFLIVHLLALFGAYWAAEAARNWWHAGSQK